MGLVSVSIQSVSLVRAFNLLIFKVIINTYVPLSNQPVHPKGSQSWIFIGRTDAEAENPILWPPEAKNWLAGKDPDAGKVWRQKEKGVTEDEMVGWHHWLDRLESQQLPGVGDGQERLAHCSLWGLKESDTNERLNWTELESGKNPAFPRKQTIFPEVNELFPETYFPTNNIFKFLFLFL